MKINVGRTVKTVCWISSLAVKLSGRPECVRAILVASGSAVGEPQLEQKRTPGGTYDPQFEQCMLTDYTDCSD